MLAPAAPESRLLYNYPSVPGAKRETDLKILIQLKRTRFFEPKFGYSRAKRVRALLMFRTTLLKLGCKLQGYHPLASTKLSTRFWGLAKPLTNLNRHLHSSFLAKTSELHYWFVEAVFLRIITPLLDVEFIKDRSRPDDGFNNTETLITMSPNKHTRKINNCHNRPHKICVKIDFSLFPKNTTKCETDRKIYCRTAPTAAAKKINSRNFGKNFKNCRLSTIFATTCTR